MPYNAATRPFYVYYHAVRRSTTQILCPHCNLSMLPKNFEKHSFEHHNIHFKTLCVWCRRVTWPAGKKSRHGHHLLTCFRDFTKSQTTRVSEVNSTNNFTNSKHLSETGPSTSDFTNSETNNRPSDTNHPPSQAADAIVVEPMDIIDTESYRLPNMTHRFRERDFFGHQMSHPDPFLETLEQFLNTPVQPIHDPLLPPLPIEFADDNLNLAARCVLLHLQGTHTFFHVMVKLSVWESFRQAMNEDRGTSRTLPFSCWCDGGPYEEDHLRQHRHAIVVSPSRDHFESMWEKVKLPRGRRPPKPNYPCKTYQTITTPLYLVNAIGYVCKRKSRCNFSFGAEGPEQNNHFYLYKTLPVDFKLHLCLLWNNGILQLLWQTHFQNVSVARLAQGILTHDGRQWTQKIKDFYKHERGLVAHVAKDYVPTTTTTDDRITTTPHFLWLAEGKKLYFNKSPENRNMDQRTWLRKQIEGGNRFYDAVEECTWIPRPRDQKVLEFHMPVVERCRELEARVAELEDKDKNAKSQMDEKDKIIEGLRLQLEQTTREKDQIIEGLRLQLEQTTREKDQIIEELVKENKTLQSKLENALYETNYLRDVIIRCKDKEIERLEKENAKLALENEKLVYQISQSTS